MYKLLITRIKELQGEKSVSAFARYLEMPQKTVDTYINGERKPSVEFIMRVCSKCHVSSDWLLGLTDLRAPFIEAPRQNNVSKTPERNEKLTMLCRSVGQYYKLYHKRTRKAREGRNKKMMPNRKLICTKPANARRFNRAIETTLAWPVLLLYVPEVAAIAEKARSVGELEYNPGFDIDRFALKCTRLDVEPDGCPAFKKLRELLEAFMLDGRNLDPSFVSIEVEKDLLDGKVHVTRVCHGDGTCGPVAEYHEDGLEAWPELCAACAECDKHAEKCPGDADDGNDKLVHCDSIPFFKRLIGRRKRTKGKD